MIYTCTLNPSIDYFITLDSLTVGKVNRVKNEAKVPGGKGINVSRILKRFGIENKATGFIGGFTGDFILTALKAENVDTDFVKISGESRINIKLKELKETEINGNGPQITSEELKKLFLKLDNLQSGDFLVLAGSTPASMESNSYVMIAERLRHKGVELIVDTTKKGLLNLLDYKPFLIKPNQHELAEFFDTRVDTIEDAIPYGEKLVKLGAKHVIVTLAGKGALYFTENIGYHASVPKGEVQNSVGAGDSVVAGFLASYTKNKNPLESFQYGVAAGTATAFSKGICKPSKVAEIVNQIAIKPI